MSYKLLDDECTGVIWTRTDIIHTFYDFYERTRRTIVSSNGPRPGTDNYGILTRTPSNVFDQLCHKNGSRFTNDNETKSARWKTSDIFYIIIIVVVARRRSILRAPEIITAAAVITVITNENPRRLRRARD